MANTEEGKGNSTLRDSNVDHAKEFQDEKIRMAEAKSAMTRTIKRLETTFTDFKDFNRLDSTNIENLYGIASEVNEIRNDVKEIESVNEILEKKLLKLNRARGVPEVQKVLDDLSNVLEEYWRKWELVLKENAESDEGGLGITAESFFIKWSGIKHS